MERDPGIVTILAVGAVNHASSAVKRVGISKGAPTKVFFLFVRSSLWKFNRVYYRSQISPVAALRLKPNISLFSCS
jgi:hypothetical protein